MGWYASMTHPEHGPVTVALPVFTEDDGCTMEAFAPPNKVKILTEGDGIVRGGDGVNVAIECACNECKLERSETDFDGKAFEETPGLLEDDVDRGVTVVGELVDNDDDNGAFESDKITSGEEADCAFTDTDCELGDETAIDVVLSVSISHAFEHVRRVL
jgi:hypothetical protein